MFTERVVSVNNLLSMRCKVECFLLWCGFEWIAPHS